MKPLSCGALLIGRLILMGLFASLQGCCWSGGGAAAVKIPIPVIDVHTHVFNAHDLPLKGILGALGAPDGVDQVLADVVDQWTPSDDIDRTREVERPDTAPVAGNLTEVAAKVRSASVSRSRALNEPLLTAEQKRVLNQYVNTSRELVQINTAKTPDESAVELVAKALAQANFPPSDSAGENARGLLTDLGGYIRFLGVITSEHDRIVYDMTHRQYPQVRLFVDHMMDMAAAYGDAPQVPFDQQWDAMTGLDRHTGGMLVHFVAYDPFRRKNALEYVKRGLAAGAIGVKFYPPSGYSSTDNTIETQPAGDNRAIQRWRSRYGGAQPLNGAAIDDLNNQLFQYCVDNDVPIFTHCTPTGFQAADGYGAKADPRFWGQTLHQFPKLRLCFGHAGGDDYWFSPGNDVGFGVEVVQLCLRYENVFCETGYLEQILATGNVERFRNRLASVIDLPSQCNCAGHWKFGDKFMYGTDWFMIAKETHPEIYLVDFWKLFDNDHGSLKKWERAFFGRNAVRFLRLSDVAADARFTPTQRQYWQKLIADVNAQ
jgi:predicted TIM-barrel fold metal-dependent hydrolase